MYSVFIVDDEYNAILRLQELLSSVDCVKVIGNAGNYQDAIDGVIENQPDIVFMDVEIRDRTGFEVIKAVNERGVSPKVIFVTGHIQYAVKALRLKASDYLLKPVDLEDLNQAIARIVMESEHSLNSTMGLVLKHNPLSIREKQILESICKGHNSHEIAEELYLSVHTIDTYRRRLLKHFNVRNTSELMSVLLQSLLSQG